MNDTERMGFDASEVLAAALEEMDGIIATYPDTTNDYQNGMQRFSPRNEPLKPQYSRAMRLMEELKTAIELCDDKKKVMDNTPQSVVLFFQQWTQVYSDNWQSEYNGMSIQNGCDCEVNSCICPSTSDKFEMLESDKQTLSLQVSVLSDQVDAQAEKIRDLENALDDNRRELIDSEGMYQSELLKKTTLETHKLDLMAEISNLKIRVAAVERDKRDLDDKLRYSQRHIAELDAKITVKDSEISDLRHRLTKNGTVIPPDHYSEHEIDKLKRAVETLMISNDDKDHRIDDLKRMLRRYRRIEDMVLNSKGKKPNIEDVLAYMDDDNSSTGSSTTPSVSDATVKENPHAEEFRPDRQYLPSPSATSTPVHYMQNDMLLPNHNMGSPVSAIHSSTPKKGVHKSNSLEDLPTTKRAKSPPTGKRKDAYNTGYARTEVVTDDEDGLQHIGHHQGIQYETKKKKGLRRFFGKLKRSSSQDFDHDRPGEFRRGGTRATATARLGWTRDIKTSYDMSIPFARWDSERVTTWMNDIGLNMYLVECRRWVKHGDQLIKASPHELEKELGMKNPLHRKKLQLNLQAVRAETNNDKFSLLDYNWVTRWLDDIGLPQYKDNFYDARIDGRMLHYMTVEDLLALKVSNELHHISIRCGIQMLRMKGFNPGCLKRRPSPDEPELMDVANEVMLWTNHRVMEWLRTIDLSEYAPNLRGSGVHGALMILEARFNSELFAQLLSIPNSKTLLRRHLSTHFVSLIGSDMQCRKREQESQPGFIPLVSSNKVKRPKFGLFGHKRTKSETEYDGFICPMESHTNGTNGHANHVNEKQSKEINNYSKEITSLTNNLSHEPFFERGPTSNV